LLLAEKELSELLQEVFDGYESDTSEMLAATDAVVSNVQLPHSDNVDIETERLSQDPLPRKLRSTVHVKNDDDDNDDDGDADCSHRDADCDAFRYPGHIPPLKYAFILAVFYLVLSKKLFLKMIMTQVRCFTIVILCYVSVVL